MSIERARAYLKEFGMEERIMELAESSATVELAAEALHCEPERIAKTLSFLMGEQPILIVAAGDARIDNHKYKTTFGTKAKMIPAAAWENIRYRHFIRCMADGASLWLWQCWYCFLEQL